MNTQTNDVMEHRGELVLDSGAWWSRRRFAIDGCPFTDPLVHTCRLKPKCPPRAHMCVKCVISSLWCDLEGRGPSRGGSEVTWAVCYLSFFACDETPCLNHLKGERGLVQLTVHSIMEWKSGGDYYGWSLVSTSRSRERWMQACWGSTHSIFTRFRTTCPGNGPSCNYDGSKSTKVIKKIRQTP